MPSQESSVRAQLGAEFPYVFPVTSFVVGKARRGNAATTLSLVSNGKIDVLALFTNEVLVQGTEVAIKHLRYFYRSLAEPDKVVLEIASPGASRGRRIKFVCVAFKDQAAVEAFEDYLVEYGAKGLVKLTWWVLAANDARFGELTQSK